jgi:DNA-binding XRE family transcriptional regulator
VAERDGRDRRRARTDALVGRLASLEREIDALLEIDPPRAAAPQIAERGRVRSARPRARDDNPRGPEIGRRIREARLSRGLTQLDLATATGIRRPNIARLERGGNTPTIETLQRIAEALGTTVSSLVTRS